MANARDLWRELGDEIIADPGNDDLRYDFASALDDQIEPDRTNSERAEFIRIQLALSSVSPDHADYMRLATRAYALELRYGEQWLSETFDNFRPQRSEFHRGFVEFVEMPAWALIEYQGQQFRDAPIQHVDIVGIGDTGQLRQLLNDLAQGGHLQKLVSLGLDGQRLNDESITILSEAPFVRLRWLSLAHNRIGRNGFQTLVSGSLRNLRFVNLDDNPFDPTTKLIYDQGVVIERLEGPPIRRANEIPWLTKTVRGGHYVQPDRFAVSS
jgi:uncharacterized protein (TIGR02996 family)